MLEEGKMVNEVYQKPSAPQESVLKDEKEVTMVEKKPFSPPGCMEEGIEEVTVVEQKLSTPPGSMLVEGKKKSSGMMDEDNSNELASPVTSVKNDSMAEDNTDELVSPVTSMKNDYMDEDNIDELVSLITSVKNDSTGSNTRPQSTGKLNAPDSGQDVIPHYLRASTCSCHDFCKYGRKHSSEAKPWHPLSKRKNKLSADETEKKMKSSSKILGGVDAGRKKDSVANYRKQIIAPKVSADKYLKTPNLSYPPKSSSVKPLILSVRSNKSLQLLAPLKDQKKMRRDGTNKLNIEMVPEKTLRTPKVKASPKSSYHLQSRPLSNEEDKKEVFKSADSALGK
ncbi:hypothetical protein CQW23_33958 [Capsicum baccatum]|uniref:Calmodulin-binding domain-containing protein n=1 Tax=Capsicum baccatum TaxID=33114 RepID=A0A2G2V081_CAPBA|nr:hypothetical protein CQW23_33958 [Capsicum baccatum]